MLYMKRIPKLIQRYHSQFLWNVPTDEKVLYLTFDDGPTPGITDWVLDTLELYEAKATFFVLGKQVKDHPDQIHRMIDSGHKVGNHGYAHIDGWKSSLRTYLLDFVRARQAIFEYSGVKTSLFRPAYLHITQTKAQYISRSHTIVMNDVISGDFDVSLSGEDVSKAVIKYAKPGSILLFHDSLKARDRLTIALPKVLAYFQDKGYTFKALKESPSRALPKLTV